MLANAHSKMFRVSKVAQSAAVEANTDRGICETAAGRLRSIFSSIGSLLYYEIFMYGLRLKTPALIAAVEGVSYRWSKYY